MTRKNEQRINAVLEAGKAKAQGNIGKALYHRALEGDIAAIRWWEMTRAKRKATQPEGDDGTTAQITRIIVERTDEG
jgi:hypothetical protein